MWSAGSGLAAQFVIAKLDRLSRNLAFIATMMDSGVEFVAVDNPHANKLTLHILAAVIQHEREMIAERTKAALQAAKHRGQVLGRIAKEQLAPRYKQEAIASRSCASYPATGFPPAPIARELTNRKIPTSKGGSWHAATVKRMLHRIEFGCVSLRLPGLSTTSPSPQRVHW
jgi:DNA invertase Pin-like site-specific DNA recombinase